MNTTRERRTAQGLCIGCGGQIEPERKGRQKCKACAVKAYEAKRLKMDYMTKTGRCTNCGKKKEEWRMETKLCETCASKRRKGGVYYCGKYQAKKE